MKNLTVKIMLAAVLAASFASAQSSAPSTLSVMPINTAITPAPFALAAAPPMIQVFIYDQVADDGFSITLNWTEADGSQHTKTKLVPRQGLTTLYSFENVTAVTANVAVYAMKFTGMAALSAAQ
jgi:hypothetical protein